MLNSDTLNGLPTGSFCVVKRTSFSTSKVKFMSRRAGQNNFIKRLLLKSCGRLLRRFMWSRHTHIHTHRITFQQRNLWSSQFVVSVIFMKYNIIKILYKKQATVTWTDWNGILLVHKTNVCFLKVHINWLNLTFCSLKMFNPLNAGNIALNIFMQEKKNSANALLFNIRLGLLYCKKIAALNF